MSVFAGSSRKAFAISQKKGISLVYLQAFREYMHIIVVSVTTHLTKPRPLSLQECLVKVAIAFAGDIRSLVVRDFLGGGGGPWKSRN